MFTTEFDALELKRQAEFYSQYETFIDNSAHRFERPAEAILAAEGRRASNAFAVAGRSAALAEPDDAVWLAYLTRLWIVTAPAGGEMVAEWLGEGGSNPAALEATLSASASSQIKLIGPEKAASIASTSRDIIAEAIDAEVTAPAVTAGRILKTVTARRTGRATAISYTEAHESANFGSMSAAQIATARAYDKVWLATPDDRVRDAHIKAHGQIRRLNAVFTVGGESLMYPGDSSHGASAENIVNCRCIAGYVRKLRSRQ